MTIHKYWAKPKRKKDGKFKRAFFWEMAPYLSIGVMFVAMYLFNS